MTNLKSQYFDSIEALGVHINNRLHQDYDFPICISGITGEGKSCAATHLGKKLSELNSHFFDFEANFVWNRKDVKHAIQTLPQYSMIVIDEAINNMYKREFMKGDQNSLIKLFQMCRWRNLCIAFVLPNIWSLDKEILQSYLKLWIWIRKRGEAELFVPDLNNPFIEDKWHRGMNEDLFDKNYISSSSNYAGRIMFDDFESQDKERYLEVKTRKSINSIEFEKMPSEEKEEKKQSRFKIPRRKKYFDNDEASLE